MTKPKVQLIVSLSMFGLWAFSLLLASFDGDTMVKVMTPLMTMMIGWLFADKATQE